MAENKSLKIVVGYPPTLSSKGIPLLSQNRQFQYFNNPTFLFPVAMGTAATWLKKLGYRTYWKDCIAEGLSLGQFFKFLDEEKPDLFIFDTKTPTIKQHWEIAKVLKAKYPELKLVLCGDHPTALPLESMQNSPIDFLICGGYHDFASVELADALENKKEIPKGIWYRKDGKIIENGRYELKQKLDDAPIIDRKFTRNELYQKEFNLAGRPLAYIMSGRDCWWGKCTFCVWDHTLYPIGTFRARSPENVMAEVKYLVDEIGVKEIFDDCGTITVGAWLKKFCNLMIESGYNKKVMYSCNMRFGAINLEECKLMKEAGFRLLKFGLESGNQETIDKLDKGTKIEAVEPSCKFAKDAGLTVHLTIMVGYPWETKANALKTYELAKRLMLKGYADVLQSTTVIPYPGTPLNRDAVKNNWFRDDFDPYDYDAYDMAAPVFKSPDMTPEEIQLMCNKIYHIFTDPRYILRRLINIRSWQDLLYTMKGAKAVFGHVEDFSRAVPQAE